MRVLAICSAAIAGTALVLRRQAPEKGSWKARCDALSGEVTPYYTAKEGDETVVGCVAALCGQKVGRSTDMGQEGASEAACTWNKMGDACCTDKIVNTCEAGSLPCKLGSVADLKTYNLAAVPQFKAEDATAVMEDCDGKVGGAGPVADFEAKADNATGSS